MSTTNDDGPIPGARHIRAGFVLVVVGLAAGIFGLFWNWSLVAGVALGPEYEVPGTFEHEIDEPREYLISVKTSDSSGVGPVTASWTEWVDVTELVVTDEDGQPVELGASGTQVIRRGGKGYSGVAVFMASEPGVYRFTMSTTPETTALVTRSLAGLSLKDVMIGLGSGLGVVLLIAGLLTVYTGWLKKRQHLSAAAA